MFSYFFAFVFGLFVPALASRYPKFFASDWGEWLFFVWHKPHFPKIKDKKKTEQLKQKWKKMFLFSIGWGLFLMLSFVFVDAYLPEQTHFWVKIFMCLMALLTATDQQYFLLPDIFTVPLIFLGFGYAIWGKIIPVEYSFFGACYGYFLPALAVFISSYFLRNAFGGGDVKMLAGLGAWVGVIPLCVLLLISVISFFIISLITAKRVGAYGPHLALAGIIVLFLTIKGSIPFL